MLTLSLYGTQIFHKTPGILEYVYNLDVLDVSQSFLSQNVCRSLKKVENHWVKV